MKPYEAPAGPDLPLSPPGQYLLRCRPRYLAQCCTAPPAESMDTLVLRFFLGFAES